MYQRVPRRAGGGSFHTDQGFWSRAAPRKRCAFPILPFRSYPLYSSPFPFPFPSVRFPFLPPLPPLLFASSSFPFPCFFLSVPLAFCSLASPFLSARLHASIRIRQGDTITIRLPGVGATHNHHLAITLTLHHYLTNTPVPRWQLDSPNIC